MGQCVGVAAGAAKCDGDRELDDGHLGPVEARQFDRAYAVRPD